MEIVPRFLALAVLSLGAFVLSAANASAGTIVISNNFDGVADPGETTFQLLTNDAPAGGSFDPATGVVEVGGADGGTTATGFNNTALAPVAADATSITATFNISSVDNVLFSRSNGFFLGLATGAGATDPTGAGLFNNTAASVGLRFNSGTSNTGALTATQVITEGAAGGATGLESLAGADLPAVADVEDGFTFTITLTSANTVDAFTTGLTTDINLTGGVLADPAFADFIADGVGVTLSFQGGGAGFTIDSVEVDVKANVIPEPASLALIGLGALAMVGRRRR